MSTYRLKISIPEWLDKIIAAPVLLVRRLWYGYTFRRIFLVNVKKYAIVDPEDYYRLSRYVWLARKSRNPYIAFRLRLTKVSYCPVLMHRQIMWSQLNAVRETSNAKLFIDHINRNSSDNRKSNLRIVTRAQNNRNRKMPKGSSKYKGVSFRKRKKPWKVGITVNYKHIHLGYFKNEIEAAKVYDAAAKKYYGEYAYLNFPETKQKGLKSILQRASGKLLSNFKSEE